MSETQPTKIDEFRALQLEKAATKCVQLRDLLPEAKAKLEAARAARDVRIDAGNQAHVMSCEDDVRQLERALADAEKIHASLKIVHGDEDSNGAAAYRQHPDTPLDIKNAGLRSTIHDGRLVGRFRINDTESFPIPH